MRVRFEWSLEKAVDNKIKHDLSFETAIHVFSDRFAVIHENYVKNGVVCERIIGQIGDSVPIVVRFAVMTSKDEFGIEVIRIFSARRLGRKEIKV